MLIKFQAPTGNQPVAFEADEVSDLKPYTVPNVTEVFLKNGRRHLLAAPFDDVFRRVEEAKSRG